MTLNTKYSLFDEVFFIRDNKIYKEYIHSIRVTVENTPGDHYSSITSTNIYYYIRHPKDLWLPENELFDSKEAVLKTL